MKTRTLFFTLLTSISILLIASGLTFAGSITGCVQSFSGGLYNIQFGTEPKGGLCHPGDESITWQQEGIQGPQGEQGSEGPQGPAGAGGGAPQFTLKDNNGAQVGTVITVNDDSTSFIQNNLQVTNRSVLTALNVQKADATTATVGLSVDRFNIRFQHRLVFESPDCLGPPRIRDIAAYADFPPAITMSAVVGMPGQPDVRRLYVQTDEAEVPQSPVLRSVLFDDVCGNFGIPFALPTVSMELIDGVLHQTFPGPYTLEKP